MNEQQRKAMELAIEYMNERLEDHDYNNQRHPATEAKRNDILDDIETVKEALAQPEQEPIGYLGLDDVENLVEYPHRCRNLNIWYEGGEGFAPIYTIPPRRTWVGVTDDEIAELWYEFGFNEMLYAVRLALLLEAKLKEKNT